MKIVLISISTLLATIQIFAQNNPIGDTTLNTVAISNTEHIGEIILPILGISFLAFMLVSLVKYFLDFRLKNKLIDRGMAEQLSAYLLNKNAQENQNEAIKLAILFCGLGLGLTITYLTTPINIHSLAIMAISLGLSYLVYFLYLRRQNT